MGRDLSSLFYSAHKIVHRLVVFLLFTTLRQRGFKLAFDKEKGKVIRKSSPKVFFII